eukprot:4517849-Prymnesium_polylepis.1
MVSIGENPGQFGTHSYRTCGATALFAAGADATVIRTMGRWSSDIYWLYVRACFSQTIAWSRKAGLTVVQDVAQEYAEAELDSWAAFHGAGALRASGSAFISKAQRMRAAASQLRL